VISFIFRTQFSYGEFYDMEHGIVDKCSDMITEEVLRYKSQMLEYFRVREINPNADEVLEPETNQKAPESALHYQLYTTSVARTTYEIADHQQNELDLLPTSNAEPPEEGLLVPERNHPDSRTRLHSPSRPQEQGPTPTFLTEDTTSMPKNMAVPFSKSFRIPSDLVPSAMFK
jgi:hypothetical protein